jgi:hypothetical protein
VWGVWGWGGGGGGGGLIVATKVQLGSNDVIIPFNL